MLYSELDELRWEIRKVEVFADGHMQFASAEASTGDTRLAEKPIPALEEIAKDSQFAPAEITKEEFESVWAESHQPSGPGEGRKCYHAIVWGPAPDSVGQRVTIYAKSGDEAMKHVAARFGEGTVFTLRNDEDADRIR